MEFESHRPADRRVDHGADRVVGVGTDRSADHVSDCGGGVSVEQGLGFDPFTDSPSVILDHVCDVEPGLFVQSVLEMMDPALLSPRDAVRYLQVHERVTSWWASRQSVALVAAAGRVPTVDEFVLLDRLDDSERSVRISELARDEIAAALRWGPMSTQSRIDQARLLVGPLTATHEALTMGEITPVHVRILTEAVQRLSTFDSLEQATHNATHASTNSDGESTQAQVAVLLAQVAFDADCAALQHRVLPIAGRSGFTRTKAAANRGIQAIDAAGCARRRAAARRHRDVYLTPDVDGLTTLIARLDTLTAKAIMGAINAGITNPAITGSAIAGSCASSYSSTVGERRSDVLAALIMGVHSPAVPGAPGAPDASSAPGDGDSHCGGSCTTPIVVNVTLDLTVPITELDAAMNTSRHSDGDNGSSNKGSSSSSMGCDFGKFMADPAIKVFVRPVAVSQLGHVLDVGRRRYQITGALRRMIITRDGTCRFPGCGAAASRCQIDHVVPWDEGGASDVGNLGALCVRHHQLKTHGGWELTNSTPDGSCTWRSPQGFNYHHYPEPITEPRKTPVTNRNTNTSPPDEHPRNQPDEQREPPDIPSF